jgi:adenosylmethionine-8-amino-7-oxononanoate aminotransferase
MLAHGVIARPIPPSTIAFCPPFVVTDDEIDQMIDALEAGLDAAR